MSYVLVTFVFLKSTFWFVWSRIFLGILGGHKSILLTESWANLWTCFTTFVLKICLGTRNKRFLGSCPWIGSENENKTNDTGRTLMNVEGMVWIPLQCFFRCILFVTSQNMWLGLTPKESEMVGKVRIGNGREDLFEVLSLCFLIPLHSKGTFCKEITPTCQHHGILGWSSWTKLPFFKRSDTTTMHHHPDFFQIKLLLDLQKSLENKYG